MKVKLLRPWRHYPAGFVLEVGGGVADVLCNRRRPPLSEYVEQPQVHTLVPAIPGLHQLVEQVTGKKRKAHG